jgi:NADPH:quinone reductase-like Zn-dependent oxidoreductase
MKAVVFNQYGPPDVLQLKEVQKPGLRDHEVRIRVRATTVTAGDCEIRRFDLPLLYWLPIRLYMGIAKPRINIPGQELSGDVEWVGGRVSRFKPGDRVFAATDARFGAYAEYVCLPGNGAISLMPANMTYEEAACVPVGGLNALHFLRKAKVEIGQKVLIYGASGSIGTFAVQLAKTFGAEVTGVCGPSNVGWVKALGADEVIDYTKEDFARNGAVYDAVFDTVGKSSFSRCLASIRKNGYYLLAAPDLGATLRGLWTSITGRVNVVLTWARYGPDELAFLKGLIEAGKIKSVIDERYPLERIVEAHRYVEKGHKKGNVVVTLE